MQRSNQSRIGLGVTPLSPLAGALHAWDEGSGPLYNRLAERLRATVSSGQAIGGSKLPPERRLAAYLGVARNTVVRAYRQLEAEGVVVRRQGSGTVVASGLAALGGQPAELSTVIQRNVIVRLLAESGDTAIDFLGAHARSGPAANRRIRDAFAAVEAAPVIGSPGYYPMGYPPLREAIAAHLSSSGLPSDAEQILVTSGAQQAITLVATGLVRGRRNVIVEDPTFPGAIDSFRMAGGRLLTVPVREHGVDLDRLGALLEDSDVALAYLMPTHHNPTGSTMPATTRGELIQLAEATGLVLVEDNALADIGLVEVPPPLGALARRGIVLSIGSLSKLFWGGLRIGWLRGPREMIAHLGQVKATADLGSSVFSQLVAVRLLAEAEAAANQRRTELGEALDVVEGLLRRHLPEWTWQRPTGGLSLWVRLPYGSASELARIAIAHGVAIVPGSAMSARGAFDDHLRLPLGREPETMGIGIERLAVAWTEYTSARVGLEGMRVVV